ncbi:uncharacterized protein MYCFIDRAFT_208611 [Pseudocercospora fijiensis CIRAD86]|uniref:Uncharacterized protein n=1 Tax=Pseudocercospora fijiensis (strain CIRAD86) TaxID=383855 RepID=M3ASP4_PSEFD|nr:uncharacterized protein MYCFIDRAFT_208611 [Pseudocercospora fijiensis CIRAD86]EME80517.1 hypothetical protein MYCFIDRAFT_208611 [Pseudocercospora fijiensis CIRAD86]
MENTLCTTTRCAAEASNFETYTGLCTRSVQSTFQSYVQRVDSLRQECTKSYGTDSMCFDEQKLCASQEWPQVPQWLRDGVTTCLARDADYTVRAHSGTYSFIVTSLASSLASSIASPGPPQSQAVLLLPTPPMLMLKRSTVAVIVVEWVRGRTVDAHEAPKSDDHGAELDADAGMHEKEGKQTFEPDSNIMQETLGWERPKEPVERFASDAGVEMDDAQDVKGELLSSHVGRAQEKA